MDDADVEKIAEDVEDGTYYPAAREWYSTLFHVPIAERSYYLIVILLAIINGYFAITAFSNVFPIMPRVPFVTYSNDIYEDLPRIIRISSVQGEDKNIAVMKFLIRNYVTNHESYDLPHFEWRYRNIWSQSTEDVFNRYKALMDASNPYSPYREYTNVAKREINIISLEYEPGQKMSRAHVVFDASVISLSDNEQVRHNRWRADVTYKYTDLEVDQSLPQRNLIAQFFGLTGNTVRASGERHKVVPMTFMVYDYQVKELLE